MNTPHEVTGPINLGNTVEITIRELAATVVRLTGSKSRIVHRRAAQGRPAPAVSGHLQGGQGPWLDADHTPGSRAREDDRLFRAAAGCEAVCKRPRRRLTWSRIAAKRRLGTTHRGSGPGTRWREFADEPFDSARERPRRRRGRVHRQPHLQGACRRRLRAGCVRQSLHRPSQLRPLGASGRRRPSRRGDVGAHVRRASSRRRPAFRRVRVCRGVRRGSRPVLSQQRRRGVESDGCRPFGRKRADRVLLDLRGLWRAPDVADHRGRVPRARQSVRTHEAGGRAGIVRLRRGVRAAVGPIAVLQRVRLRPGCGGRREPRPRDPSHSPRDPHRPGPPQ